MMFSRFLYHLSWVPTTGRYKGLRHYADHYTNKQWLRRDLKKLVRQGAEGVEVAKYARISVGF